MSNPHHDLLIKIHNIPSDKPLRFSGAIHLNELERMKEVVTSQEVSIHFEAEVSGKGETIAVKAEITGSVFFACDRCLESFPYAFNEKFSLVLMPENEDIELELEMILSFEDLDTDYYRGEYLDLLELLEEQILLGVPVQKICSEECKGICVGCGKNLNQRACTCPPKDLRDHPFGVLLDS